MRAAGIENRDRRPRRATLRGPGPVEQKAWSRSAELGVGRREVERPALSVAEPHPFVTDPDDLRLAAVHQVGRAGMAAKNALFAGRDEGAAAWAGIASLIETCKMNDVEPHAWLKSTLEKIAAGHPQPKIHELLPGTSIPTPKPADRGAQADPPIVAVKPVSVIIQKRG